MRHLKVRVENGKIIGDAPEGLAEGTELELELVDPGDDMTAAEIAELNRALEASWRSVQQGKTRPVEEWIAAWRWKR